MSVTVNQKQFENPLVNAQEFNNSIYMYNMSTFITKILFS